MAQIKIEGKFYPLEKHERSFVVKSSDRSEMNVSFEMVGVEV